MPKDEEERQNLLNQMWRNGCISDTYEPGSIFKVFTASAALEAGAEAAELLEEEPPQAARDRARQRAVAIAIYFFMLDFSFFKWGRAGPVPSEKPEAGGFCAARASSPAGCF